MFPLLKACGLRDHHADFFTTGARYIGDGYMQRIFQSDCHKAFKIYIYWAHLIKICMEVILICMR